MSLEEAVTKTPISAREYYALLYAYAKNNGDLKLVKNTLKEEMFYRGIGYRLQYYMSSTGEVGFVLQPKERIGFV